MDSTSSGAHGSNKAVNEGSNNFDSSFESFQLIFSDVVRELNGSIIAGEEEGGAYKQVVTVSFPDGLPVRIYLPKMHRKLACGGSDSEERCAADLKSWLKNYVQDKVPSSSHLPNRLILRVITKSFAEEVSRSKGDFSFTGSSQEENEKERHKLSSDSEDLSAPEESASEMEARLVVQSFSCRSGDLVLALGIKMAYGNIWINEKNLKSFDLSESRAFELAIEKIEEATPSPLESHFARVADSQVMEALEERLQQNGYDICCFRSFKGTHVFVWVGFDDCRTLSRLILPRFIECLAGALECAATSTVVIPFSKSEVYAGNCESWKSMWFLGEEMAREECEVDMSDPSSGHVSIRPYRVGF